MTNDTRKSPREFWLTSKSFTYITKNPKLSESDYIHVIEYSAYEDLKTGSRVIIETMAGQLEALKSKQESISLLYFDKETSEPISLEALRKERDEYRAALEKASKDIYPDSLMKEVLAKYPKKESK